MKRCGNCNHFKDISHLHGVFEVCQDCLKDWFIKAEGELEYRCLMREVDYGSLSGRWTGFNPWDVIVYKFEKVALST